jgi:hypothetical protein
MNQVNTREFILELLKGEIQEFEENPTWDEVADLVIFTITLANQMGLDVDEIVRTKIAYNHARYPAKDFQKGDYNEARLRGKQTENLWKPVFIRTNPPIGEE